MKDFVLDLALLKNTFNEKLNTMREYLQAYILRTLYENRFFFGYAFVGGTALRFLYGLPRFSQDLDFSLARRHKLQFAALVKKIERELVLAGYDLAVAHKEKAPVYSAMFKFRGLMYEAGLSAHRDENFSIKIEIDNNPPKGAKLENMLVNKYFILSFLCYDISSLFAGKLHAILSRKYTKGRDFFDLGWYLTKWKDISPNIPLLTNALKQTGWRKEYPRTDNWKDFLAEVVTRVDWALVKRDVESFLENPKDAGIFTKENILKLLHF